MNLSFFPGTELSPPFLLGEIIDLDRPRRVLANVFVDENGRTSFDCIINLSGTQRQQLEQFAATIDPSNVKPIALSEILGRPSRRQSMC